MPPRDGKPKNNYNSYISDHLSCGGDTSFLNEVTFTGSVSDASTGLQYIPSLRWGRPYPRFAGADPERAILPAGNGEVFKSGQLHRQRL